MMKKKLRIPEKKTITPTEKRVLKLISPPDCKDTGEIAAILGVSDSRVRNIKLNLRKKGFLNIANRPTCNILDNVTHTVTKRGGSPRSSVTPTHFQLHDCTYSIRMLRKGDRFKKHFASGNTIYHMGAFIQIHKSTVDVHLNKDFIGVSIDECDHKEKDYLGTFLFSLENRLDAMLVRERTFNIKRTFCKYSRVNDGISQTIKEEHGEFIKIYGSKDGVLWASTDKSGNWHTHTQHPKTAKEDMKEILNPIFNDWKDNIDKRQTTMTDICNILKAHSQLMAEQSKISDQTNKHLKDSTAGLESLVTLLGIGAKPKPANKTGRADKEGDQPIPNYIR